MSWNLANIWSRSLFVLCVACLSLAGMAQELSQESAPQQRGLLWIVESDNAESSYLFGTIHTEEPQVLELVDELADELKSSRMFVMELEPRPGTVEELSLKMHFSDGRNLRTVLGESLFESAVEAMATYNVPQGLVVKMKPWAVVLTLSVPPPKTGLFLDMALYMMALRNEIPVLGLETVDEQLEFFDTLRDDQQVELLEETLTTRDKLEKSFQELLAAYLDRDLAEMERLNNKYLDETDPEIAELFRARLLDARNLRMLDRMIPALRDGRAFIAVGALHLPGETGLIRGLREKGYRVTPIY